MNSSTNPVDIRPDHLAIVRDILRAHLPAGFEVWVFGSRANWTTKDSSDLDLAVEGAARLDYRIMGDLEIAFEESDLLYAVDVVDLKDVSPEFKNIVDSQKVPLLATADHPNPAEEWEERPFEEVIDFREGPGILAKDFREDGVPLVRLAGLSRGASVLAGCNYLDPESSAKRWDQFRLEFGDVLLSTSASLGRIAVVGEEGIGAVPYTGIIRMRPRDTTVHRPFIRYLLEGPDFQQQCEVVGVGSVIRHFGPMHLRQMTLKIPPLPEQRAIAHILGTLDDKIELNRRMNQTLESMARAIFQDWFVDFGPVRAKLEGQDPYLPSELWDLFPDELVDSELGEIPEGWEVGNLGDVARSPTRSVSPAGVEEETPYIGLEHMPRRSIALSEWESADKVTSNKLAFQKGEFLFGKLRPYFHKVGTAPVDGICSTDMVVVRPIENSWSSFVLLCVSTDEFVGYTDQTSTGTRMPRTNWKTMSRYELCLPPEPIAQVFQGITEHLLDRILANIHQARSAASQRNALVPKLISGEVQLV